MWGLLHLLLTFSYIGLFSIGGGLVALPFIRQEVIRNGWVTLEQFFQMVAVSESTPGPIGINMATYVGFSQYGVIGGIATTIGNVLPSLIIIMIIAKFFKKFSDYPVVKAAFYGIRAAVVGLVATAVYDVFTVSILHVSDYMVTNQISSLIDIKATIIFLGIFYLYQKFNKHPIFYIGLGAILGVIFL